MKVCPLYRSTEACLDNSRGHAVDSDVAVSQFWGQCSGQAEEGCLTHTIGTQRLYMETPFMSLSINNS